MKIIGLTGGIGSGKSTVANMFKLFHVPIFIADDVSKMLLGTNEVVIAAVKDLLGEQSYTTNLDNELIPDKKYIASKVFKDVDLLKGLNAILHPAVRTYFDDWLLKQDAAYIIYEAAILFESGGHKRCDAVLLITTNIEERVNRVMQRDQTSREEVEARLSNQWSDIERLNLSDFVIINNNLETTKTYVSIMHDVLLNS